MKNTHTLTCSKKKYKLQVFNQLIVELELNENPYNLQLNDLFQMAARINKKRSFLFVSKVLGKHIPIDPKIGLLTGALLANRYMEKVKNTETTIKENLLSFFTNGTGEFSGQPFIDGDINPVIIGFAETATALGHAFFQSFQKADFFHTTRELIRDLDSVISFEEEHSHATSHRCYIDESVLNNNREIILVDDEMTTGKTAVNIIRSIHERFPRKSYTVVSILDWRSKENHSRFDDLEKELGIIIHSVSLLKGTITVSGTPDIKESIDTKTEIQKNQQSISYIHLDKIFPGKFEKVSSPSVTLGGEIKKVPYLKETGRFGLKASENIKNQESIEEIGQYLAHQRNGIKTLCLGTGEFMYLPMKIASLMGSGVHFHSTTRSPIYIDKKENYGARHGLSFPNPEDKKIAQFVYNIPPKEYDELFLFLEREVFDEELKPLLKELEKTQVKEIKVVFFNGGLTDE